LRLLLPVPLISLPGLPPQPSPQVRRCWSSRWLNATTGQQIGSLRPADPNPCGPDLSPVHVNYPKLGELWWLIIPFALTTLDH
uniref:Uncharacterized protein n=1 Tax=Triticum urartu TaxID=4572 RepID=A0A8R7UMU7_TRIUA